MVVVDTIKILNLKKIEFEFEFESTVRNLLRTFTSAFYSERNKNVHFGDKFVEILGLFHCIVFVSWT